MNYELTDAGLVTRDPVIASMFLGKKIRTLDSEWLLITVEDNGEFGIGKLGDEEPETYAARITIPYPLVREAYQPVEGEGYVYDDVWEADGALLRVGQDMSYIPHRSAPNPTQIYHKRVVNIVTTRAELRALVAKCQEAGK